METSWSYIVDLMFSAEYNDTDATWLELTLYQTWTLASLEDRISEYEFAAFSYSLLVQHWRSAALHGDFTGSQWWSEAHGSVAASQPLLSAQLHLTAPQLILGCVCILALITTSAVSMLGLQIQRGPVMDGSVMNMMSLLRSSSLPAIFAGNNDEGTGTNSLRRRAERTMVM